MWKKNLGVEAKLQNQEWKTMLDTMHTHNFDAVRYAWMCVSEVLYSRLKTSGWLSLKPASLSSFFASAMRLSRDMGLDKDIIADKVMGQGQRPAWLISQPDIGGVTLKQ
jgi:hypothetical protein